MKSRKAGGDGGDDDADTDAAENQKVTSKKVPLEDSRSLRESLLGKHNDSDNGAIAPAVLLRMLRRAAVLEAQHREETNQVGVAKKAKEIVERVARAERLKKLAKVVEKKTEGQVNRATEKQRQKFKPGTTTRTR